MGTNRQLHLQQKMSVCSRISGSVHAGPFIEGRLAHGAQPRKCGREPMSPSYAVRTVGCASVLLQRERGNHKAEEERTEVLWNMDAWRKSVPSFFFGPFPFPPPSPCSCPCHCGKLRLGARCAAPHSESGARQLQRLNHGRRTNAGTAGSFRPAAPVEPFPLSDSPIQRASLPPRLSTSTLPIHPGILVLAKIREGGKKEGRRTPGVYLP